MEPVARKLKLQDEKIAPLIDDPKLAAETFESIMVRGWSFYPSHGSEEGFPRVFRIVPLKGS